jgi:hypothetical protein
MDLYFPSTNSITRWLASSRKCTRALMTWNCTLAEWWRNMSRIRCWVQLGGALLAINSKLGSEEIDFSTRKVDSLIPSRWVSESSI